MYHFALSRSIAARALRLLAAVIVLLTLAGVAAWPAQVATAGEDERAQALYIVQLRGEPLASYKGSLSNLAPTSPAVTHARKLDVRSTASSAYRANLARQHAQVVAAISRALGRDIKLAYRYDVVYNGLGVRMTAAEAAQVARPPEVVRVRREVMFQLQSDAGPQWIKADRVWDGSATALFVATLVGGNEVPPVQSAASGSATFTLSGSTMSYTLRTSGLSPIAAEIHRPDSTTVTALTSTDGAGLYTGSVALSQSDLDALKQGTLYVDVHTAAYPGGEIRGQITGTRGEGMLIGVIDTGINFGHPSFAARGDDGYIHVNPFGPGRYKGVCDPTDPTYQPNKVCNAKLVGARTYPDIHGFGGSPEDDDGHGSHTASTAAGNVLKSVVLNGVEVGPISGVAPHANMIAYDVCISGVGCPMGAVLAAINDAVADGVDVINFSIGSASSDPCASDDALAFLKAREAGVFVSIAAGNSGPAPSMVSSPANAPWVMAVAATTHNRSFVNRVTGLSGGLTAPPPDIVGKGLTPPSGMRPIIYADAAPYANPLCNRFPYGTDLGGAIVVCDRGTIGRVEKGQNVLAAHGGGMISGQWRRRRRLACGRCPCTAGGAYQL